MADAERKDEAVEFRLAPRIDAGKELVEPLIGALLGRQHFLAPGAARLLALPCLFLAPVVQGALHAVTVALELEHVSRGLEQALLEEQLDVLPAQSLDIHRTAGHEVLEMLDGLRRTDQLARATTPRV